MQCRKNANARRSKRHLPEHRTRLREAAQAIVGARDVAEDVIQSAYVKLLELSEESVIRNPVGYC